MEYKLNLTKSEKRKLVELLGVNGFQSAGNPPSAVLSSLEGNKLININNKRIELTGRGRATALSLTGGRL